MEATFAQWGDQEASWIEAVRKGSNLIGSGIHQVLLSRCSSCQKRAAGSRPRERHQARVKTKTVSLQRVRYQRSSTIRSGFGGGSIHKDSGVHRCQDEMSCTFGGDCIKRCGMKCRFLCLG